MSTYKKLASLARLRIEMPQLTKKDKKATDDAESANNAHGAGHYRKDLYPKHLIDPIVQVAAAARAYMYGQTRPYGYSGSYLLPHNRLMGYMEQMGKYELAFKQAVTAFLSNWTNVLVAAQQAQGQLYDPTQYPDVSSLARQFTFESTIRPFASVSDTIMDELDADVRALAVAEMEKAEAQDSAVVTQAAIADLREQVLRIVRQTTLTSRVNARGETELKPGKIYESLTTDIKELTDLLADLNYAGSPALQELSEQIDMHLTLPAAALKQPDVCSITNEKAKEILAAMEQFA